MCKDPCIPKVDHLQEFGSAVASAVGTVSRLAVRVGCRWFSDEQLVHGRVQIRWKLSWLAALAASLSWWLGRAAAFVWAGAFVVSWMLHHALRVELERRRQRELDARAARHAQERSRIENQEPQAPDLDEEAAALFAAARATKEGR